MEQHIGVIDGICRHGVGLDTPKHVRGAGTYANHRAMIGDINAPAAINEAAVGIMPPERGGAAGKQQQSQDPQKSLTIEWSDYWSSFVAHVSPPEQVPLIR